MKVKFKALREKPATGRQDAMFYKTIVASANDLIYIVDKNLRIKYANNFAAKRLKFKAKNIIGKKLKELFPQKCYKEQKISIQTVFESGKALSKESKICFSGNDMWLDTRLIPIKNGSNKVCAVIGMSRDITERKAMENALKDSERKYRMLFEDSRDAIYITTKDGMFIDINRAGLDLFGYTRDEVLGINVQTIYVNPFTKEKFQQVINKQGAVKNYEVKLRKKDGTEIDCFLTTTVRISIEGDVIGYQGIIRDITMHKQAENHLKESYEKLERILDETVMALATTTEKRDPYTAGHQQRVAQLASAIAVELGMSEETIEGIRVAGVLHDIGKICVPSEILNKPSHLSKIEFDIVKTHPQASHDIVKTIEFPWPIAQILLQHHERLDGSGYPLGLTGDSILLEAKIIAVADVVEAMMSNRPYRPAFTIEEAMDEIVKNKGTLYYSKIVDICVKLFNEKKFMFQYEE